MIVRLNDENKLELTEKAFIVRPFREMYNYYVGKLDNDDRAMAAFGVLYYMYYFDSQFLIKYPDEEERFKEVKKYVYRGEEISRIKVFEKAEEAYKELMDQEQTALYLVMKKNVDKLKDFAERMVLVKPQVKLEEDEDGNLVPKEDEEGHILVKLTDFMTTNSSLPKQEEELRAFRERLQQHFKNKMDVYGGGDLGAYE